MTTQSVAYAFAILGMCLTMVVSVPQILVLRRSDSIGSLSATTWELAAASYATWVAYGFLLPIYPQVPGNLIACAGAIAVLVGIARRDGSWFHPLAVRVPLLFVAVASYDWFGAAGLGWMAFCTTISRTAPQIWLLLRYPYSGGVSRGTWLSTAAGSGSWLVYAILMGDTPVLASTTVGLSTAIAIALLARAAPKRAFQPAIVTLGE